MQMPDTEVARQHLQLNLNPLENLIKNRLKALGGGENREGREVDVDALVRRIHERIEERALEADKVLRGYREAAGFPRMRAAAAAAKMGAAPPALLGAALEHAAPARDEALAEMRKQGRVREWNFDAADFSGADSVEFRLSPKAGTVKSNTHFSVMAWSYRRSEWVKLDTGEEGPNGVYTARLDFGEDYSGVDGKIRVLAAGGEDYDVEAVKRGGKHGGDESGETDGEDQTAEETVVKPSESAVYLSETERVLLRNADTGEVLGLRLGADGNISIDYDPANGDWSTALDVKNGQSFTFQGVRGQGARVTGGAGADWDIDVLALSEGATVAVDSVGYGTDHVNVINADNGESTSFYLGCLIQADELATSGDDVATIRLRTGQSVSIDSVNSRDKYRITASRDKGDWEIIRSDGERGWFFYTGGDIVNVINTATGRTTSFQQLADGTLMQLDDAVTDAESVTTYYFTPGTSFNFQPGTHGSPVPFNIEASGGDWSIQGVGGDARSMIASLGEGDAVRVYRFGGMNNLMTNEWYVMRGGELVKSGTAPSKVDDTTTYTLRPGDTLRLRAAGSEKDLKVISNGEAPARGGEGAKKPAGELAAPVFTAVEELDFMRFSAVARLEIQRTLLPPAASAPLKTESPLSIEKPEDGDSNLLLMILEKMKKIREQGGFGDSMFDMTFSLMVRAVAMRANIEAAAGKA